MKTNSIIKLTITTTIASILLGCASIGNNFDESKVTQIKKGQTTDAELLQTFGEPQNRTLNSDGATILTWMYTESSVKGESFIPYAGVFMGGTRSKSKILTVTLQDGKVQSFSSSDGGTESRGMTQSASKGSP